MARDAPFPTFLCTFQHRNLSLQARANAGSYPHSSIAAAGKEAGYPPTMALPNWTATARALPQDAFPMREGQAAPASPVHPSKVHTSSPLNALPHSDTP